MRDEERPPLRVVLRNFLNHIENLESQISPEKTYDIEFQALKLFSEGVKGLKEYSCLEGEKEINRKKNRYKDILPFDVSRVVLQEYNGLPGSDYINANFIKGASGSPAYIASQGPLPCTVNDFWRMVVQCEVHVIVMACNQEEAGKAKCEKYWVDEGEERHFGRISVRLLKSSTVCPDFSVRTMRLKYSNNTSMVAEERTVCQVHYVAWPDHGVPSVVHPLLDMVRLVRDTQASETLPVLVHCSAGCGRTGTICAIDYVFGLLRTGKLTSDFSLSSLIRDMRRQRIAMVQTKEQYVLVHQAVRELFREQLSVIDSHPYENVDPDGSLLIKNDVDNIYDTIDCAEEKGDFKMEKDALVAQFPNKKNVTLYSSKQEKEVENLTEQLRTVQAAPKQRAFSNIPLKNSHFTCRLPYKQEQQGISNKPIPSKGILRVPLLPVLGGHEQTAGSSASAGSVKRSKSLKVMPVHRERGLEPRLTVPPEPQKNVGQPQVYPSSFISTQTKHRSSLELKIPESTAAVNLNESRPVNEVTKKYNVLNASGRKQLIRSYTTLDMRHKLTLASRERRTHNMLDGRFAINSSYTQVEKTNLAEHRYGEPSSSTTVRQENKPNGLRNIYTPPSLEPPARSFTVRERSSKNFVTQQSTLHFGSSGQYIAPQPALRQYPISNSSQHHRTPVPKTFPLSHAFYTKKSKVKLPNRELKEVEGQHETSPELRPDKFKSLNSEGPQHIYDHKASKPVSSIGQNVPLYPPLPPRNQFPLLPSVHQDVQIRNPNFATAPGVDIDQVAASIPNKDGSKSNLMKVALEAFQTKKLKQQSRPSAENVSKGSPVNYQVSKKKQQQYL